MGKPEILIVDDDASLVGYVSQFLRSRGYIVRTLEAADRLLETLAGGASPSVILLDVMFPGVNGLEILAQLRKAYPSIPVIMLSAVGHTKGVVEAVRMGAFDYLTKPFEEQELELAIEDVLQKRACKTR